MGHTFIRANIFDKNKVNSKEVALLVDTGSTYSWIKRTTLDELGIKPVKSRKFQTLEGKIITRQLGEVIIEYDGESATTIVVFGEEKDKEVLGVVTMEELAVEVDPVTQKIKKSESLFAI